ncbi:radical SAM/SPASM domain-containing protein [Ruminococcus sp. XPD3002]|uniref:radical SAM/SPASM domain-containing protein n=1 Tax=Ruminococcus sp. XPD3002 TaxID=1452269 RepID=UPI000915B31F|nr:uncharacterized protein SAMN04487832_11947 [Ruminococcus flavefaciens]
MGLSKQNYVVDGEYLAFTIWTTSYCNFNCKYCYETENKPSNYMDRETADKVFAYIRRQAKNSDKKSLWIGFHGGEPMLNTGIIKYFLDMFEADDEITYFTSMTTNGSVMDEDIINRISEVSVSLDGAKESHNKNRITRNGEGTYDLIIGNIKKIMEIKNNDIRLRMVVTPDNTEDFFDNVMYAASLGFTMIVPCIDFFNKDWNDEKFRLLYDEAIRIKEYRQENWSDKNIRIAIIDDQVKRMGDCEIGIDGFQIGVDGSLYHCMYTANDPSYSIGNIFDGIDESIAEEVNCLNRKKPEECNGCTYQPYCITQRCLILNKLTTGNYYEPSPVICKYEWLKLKLKGVNVRL